MARRRTPRIAALAAALVLCASGAARADSDPASDVLPVQNVFVPYQPRVSATMQQTLRAVTAAAAKARFPVKVAIIASAQDLGGVPDFFNKPQPYARYLGSEISFSKPQPLIVVMPNGIGTSQVPPKPAAAARGVSVGSGADGLAATAVKAVENAAAAAGHKLGSYKGKGGGGSSSTALIFVAPILVLVIVLVALSYRRMGREEDELEEEEQPA